MVLFRCAGCDNFGGGGGGEVNKNSEVTAQSSLIPKSPMGFIVMGHEFPASTKRQCVNVQRGKRSDR